MTLRTFFSEIGAVCGNLCVMIYYSLSILSSCVILYNFIPAYLYPIVPGIPKRISASYFLRALFPKRFTSLPIDGDSYANNVVMLLQQVSFINIITTTLIQLAHTIAHRIRSYIFMNTNFRLTWPMMSFPSCKVLRYFTSYLPSFRFYRTLRRTLLYPLPTLLIISFIRTHQSFRPFICLFFYFTCTHLKHQKSPTA